MLPQVNSTVKCSLAKAEPSMPNELEDRPDWFLKGDDLLWKTLHVAHSKTGQIEEPALRVPTECASIYLINTLKASVDLNREGKHSIAIALLRQCTESVTVLELGLIDKSVGRDLIAGWKDGSKSQGNLRQELEAKIWRDYGSGLWEEPWTDYFGDLARAVNPYAHYTPKLQGWQMVVPEGMPLFKTDSGMLKSYMTYGFESYDASKATRITLLHILISWTVGRLVIENGGDEKLETGKIESLGDSIADSEILGKGELDWPQQFWANEFWGINENT